MSENHAALVANIRQVVSDVLTSHMKDLKSSIEAQQSMSPPTVANDGAQLAELKQFFMKELEKGVTNAISKRHKEILAADEVPNEGDQSWVSRHFRAFSTTLAKKQQEEEMVEQGQCPPGRKAPSKSHLSGVPKAQRIQDTRAASDASPKSPVSTRHKLFTSRSALPGIVDEADYHTRESPPTTQTIPVDNATLQSQAAQEEPSLRDTCTESNSRSARPYNRKPPGGAEPPDVERTESIPKDTYIHGYCGKEYEYMHQTSSMNFEFATPMRMIIRRVISDPKFESAVCCLIFVNAIVLGIQTDVLAKDEKQVVPPGLVALELIACIFFVVELMFRLFVHRTAFFYKNGWQWNWFDFWIVVVQVAEQVIAVAVSEDDGTSLNFSAARVVRTMKLFRLLRIARVMNFFKELRILVISILNSTRSLMWVIILLFALIYTFSIYFTQTVTERKFEAETTDEDYSRLEIYFGTLPRTMLSLFQAVSGGIDWCVLLEPLVELISPIMGVLFILFVSFTYLAMLNVVTGVFVESVLKSQASDRDQFMVSNARELFQSLDGGVEANMTWEIFAGKLDEPHLQAFLKAIDVDPSEAKHLFRLLDLDHSGEISADEFLNGALRLRGNAKALDVALLMQEVRNIEQQIRHFMRV